VPEVSGTEKQGVSEHCRSFAHGFSITGSTKIKLNEHRGRTVPWLVAAGLSSPTPHQSDCVRRAPLVM